MSPTPPSDNKATGALDALRSMLHHNDERQREGNRTAETLPDSIEPPQDTESLDIPILTDFCNEDEAEQPPDLTKRAARNDRIGQSPPITTARMEALLDQLVAQQLPALAQLLRDRLRKEIEAEAATRQTATGQHSID